MSSEVKLCDGKFGGYKLLENMSYYTFQNLFKQIHMCLFSYNLRVNHIWNDFSLYNLIKFFVTKLIVRYYIITSISWFLIMVKHFKHALKNIAFELDTLNNTFVKY